MVADRLPIFHLLGFLHYSTVVKHKAGTTSGKYISSRRNDDHSCRFQFPVKADVTTETRPEVCVSRYPADPLRLLRRAGTYCREDSDDQAPVEEWKRNRCQPKLAYSAVSQPNQLVPLTVGEMLCSVFLGAERVQNRIKPSFLCLQG
jgi:hypothetical protein